MQGIGSGLPGDDDLTHRVTLGKLETSTVRNVFSTPANIGLRSRRSSRSIRPALKKTALVQKIIQHLAAELEHFAQSARAAHAEATHEQSKAENKYDTRGLEASYLAHGQNRQAAETAQALQLFQHLEVRDFGADEAVELGALVGLERNDGRALYFVAPRAGGTEIVIGKREVLVITPHSPLGQQLVGRKKGERLPNGARVISVA